MSGYGDDQRRPRGLWDEWWTDNVLVAAFWFTAAAAGFLAGAWAGTLA